MCWRRLLLLLAAAAARAAVVGVEHGASYLGRVHVSAGPGAALDGRPLPPGGATVADPGVHRVAEPGGAETRFAVVAEAGGVDEWALRPWQPPPHDPHASHGPAATRLAFWLPQLAEAGSQVPLVVALEHAEHGLAMHNGVLEVAARLAGREWSLRADVVRGVAKLLVPAEAAGTLELSLVCGALSGAAEVAVVSDQEAATEIGGVVLGERRVTGLLQATRDVIVPRGGRLVIEGPAVLRFSPGVFAAVQGGAVELTAPDGAPVLLVGGGFDVSAGGRVTAFGALSIGSGGPCATRTFGLGHRSEPPLFNVAGEGSAVTWERSAAVWGTGQFALVAGPGAALTLRASVVARFVSGIQTRDAQLSVADSYLGEFPGSLQTDLEDTDALYIVGGDSLLTRSVIRDARDDCVDSGTGAGGALVLSGLLIEGCGHEGIALSNNGAGSKTVAVENCVVTGCQQGIELGFSTPQLFAFVGSSAVVGNQVGVRYGDNYGWDTQGFLWVRDSVVADNDVDVWNMHRATLAPVEGRLFVTGSGGMADGEPTQFSSSGGRVFAVAAEGAGLGAVQTPPAAAGVEISFASGGSVRSPGNWPWQWGIAQQAAAQGLDVLAVLESVEREFATLLRECSAATSGEPETYAVIFWSLMPAERLQTALEFLRDVSPLRVVEEHVVRGHFDDDWFRALYGDDFYTITVGGRPQTMAEHKGSGAFTLVVVQDECPQYGLRSGKTVNTLMFDTKNYLRQGLERRFVVHASMTKAEGEADLAYLFNRPVGELLEGVGSWSGSF